MVDSANAQVMLSTGMTVLRDELGMAYDVTVDGEDTIYYTSGRSGGTCVIAPGASGLTITARSENAPGASVTRELVYTANNRLQITYAKAEYFAKATAITVDGQSRTCPAGTFLLTDVQVKRGDDVLAQKGSYVICTIRPSLG